MDLFGLEDYDNGEQSMEANTDSQVIFDDMDDHLMMCGMEFEDMSQKTVLMENSDAPTPEIPKTAHSPDSVHKTDEAESSYTGDVQYDIKEKLLELSSLVNKKSATTTVGKQNTSTPISKTKGGIQQQKIDMMFGRTKQTKPSTVNDIPPDSHVSCCFDNAEQMAPVPLGGRRSNRLADKSMESSIQVESVTRSPRAPRPNANDNVEVIDLLRAPPLILPNVINLDSDDEDQRKRCERNKLLSDLSFEENYEILVKIRWNGSVQKFPLRKFQCFGDLIQKLAQEKNVNTNQVILTIGDTTIVRAEDTPDSINHNISMILAGRILSPDAVAQPKGNKKARRDKNIIKVRLQADGLKNPVEIFIDKTRKFSGIRHTIAETLKIDSAQLKLKFDGELIEVDSTPIDLDFDGGEMIDCVTTK